MTRNDSWDAGWLVNRRWFLGRIQKCSSMSYPVHRVLYFKNCFCIGFIPGRERVSECRQP